MLTMTRCSSPATTHHTRAIPGVPDSAIYEALEYKQACNIAISLYSLIIPAQVTRGAFNIVFPTFRISQLFESSALLCCANSDPNPPTRRTPRGTPPGEVSIQRNKRRLPEA